MANKIIMTTDFLGAARHCLQPPAFLEQYPSLTPPGNEAARLEGHFNGVTALCVLPDGHLASGSRGGLWNRDSTIRLWDVASGTEAACLEGHARTVTALCVLPVGRLASG